MSIDTPSGRRDLIAEGHEVEEATVPRDAPPYTNVRLGASAARDASGGLAVHCDACLGHEMTQLVDATGRAESAGGPWAIGWRGDRIEWSVDVIRRVQERRYSHEEQVLGVHVSTPGDNVIDVRDKSEPARNAGTLAGLFGVPLTILGAIFLVNAINTEPVHWTERKGNFWLAGIFGVPGLALDAAALYLLNAPTTYTKVDLPR